MIQIGTALLAAIVLTPSGSSVTPEGVAGIGRQTTRETLEALFQGDPVEHTTEHLGEGTYGECAVVFPGTPRELRVIWNEEGTPMEIRVRGTYWRTPEGIGLGSTLRDLEAAVGPFEMAGFAWDNEGYADLWETPYEGIFIRLLPKTDPLPSQFLGDALFPSASLRELNPVVVDFRVFFF